MSYVGEVLKSARNAEMVNLNSKMNSLTKTISDFKLEVINMLGTIYIDFNILGIEEGNRLSIQKKQLFEDILDADGRINTQMEKDVKKYGEELKKLTVTLKELKFEMDLISDLLNINDMLNQGHAMLIQLDWHSSVDFAQHINKIESLLDSEASNYKRLDIYNHLKEELSVLTSKFLIFITDQYSENILFWEELQDETTKEIKEIVLKINQQEQRKKFIQCLHLMDSLSQEISVFADYLLTEVLKPITRGKAKVIIVSHPDHVTIEVYFHSMPVVSHQGRSGTNTLQESADIMEHLIMLFNILYSFLHFPLDPEAENVTDESNDTDEVQTITSYYTELGAMISERFVTDLTQNCLNAAIPTSPCDIDAMDSFLNMVASLELLLKDTGFLNMESSPFCDFKKENMSNMVVNKKCTMYLEQARSIMKKSLQVTKQIEPRDVPELMNVTQYRKIAEAVQDEAPANVSICTNMFQFPLCFVSESTLELLDLTQSLLSDLCTQQDVVCNKLCHTLLNIFIMYCDVVPLYHQKLLETTPEASALLHNNCMYIAHHLCTLSDSYREKVSASKAESSSPPNVKYDLIFVDLVVMLRSLSKETLNKQLDVQRALLKTYVKQSGLDSISTQLNLDPSLESTLRQALSQLSFLRTVWEPILPRAVYTRSLGSLITCLIGELITCLVNTTDISSHVCQALVLLFETIRNHVTLLLPTKGRKAPLCKFIKNWNKFLGLISIFNSSSPRDIEDAWNCGRGPLALEFSPDEVKRLIRALIQPSEARETLLEKIRQPDD